MPDLALRELATEGTKGHAVLPARAAHWRFCHKHFNMLGRYHFAGPEEILRGELRPLRDLNDADEELLIA